MKAVRRVAPLASPIKSDLLKVMLFIIISPYLFNVVATAFASTSADSTMPIVFKICLISFCSSCVSAPFRIVVALLYVLIIGNMIACNYRISLRKTYTFKKKDIRVRMSFKYYVVVLFDCFKSYALNSSYSYLCGV